MKLAIIFSILLAFSCSQERICYTSYKHDAQHLAELGDDGFVLASNSYLFFTVEKPDSITGEWYKHFWFKGQDVEHLNEIDLSSGFYSDSLLFYKNEKTENQIFLWKQEDEYWSYIYFYLFTDGKVSNIGDLVVGKYCDECDSFNFPEERISVCAANDEIKFEFIGETVYRGSKSQNTPYHSVNKKSSRLKLVYNGYKSRIIY